MCRNIVLLLITALMHFLTSLSWEEICEYTKDQRLAVPIHPMSHKI